jgi:hypothetical protein
MPRFVVLRHEMPVGSSRASHFDLMLQRGASLRTWACSAIPAIGLEVSAEELADHRLAYLDYDGEVSAGRGSVTRVAAGEFEVLAESADCLQVRVIGDQLSGNLTLIRDTNRPAQWRVSLTSPPKASP